MNTPIYIEEALFIAACKSCKDVDKKLTAIHKQHYACIDENTYKTINLLLTNIVDKYCDVTAAECIKSLNPKDWLTGELTPHHKCVRIYLVGKIQCTKADKFPADVKDNIKDLWKQLDEMIQ